MALLQRVDDRLKGPELAVAIGTTPGFLPQVVGPLVRAGWVVSDPGPTGGYRAAQDAENASGPSVLEVIEAVDGPTEIGMCVVADAPCSDSEHCALHAAWSTARDSLLSDLSSLSVSDVYTGTPFERSTDGDSTPRRQR